MRATLVYVREAGAHRNITLSLPDEVLRRVRVMAVERRTSVSRMLAELLEEMVELETGYAMARERSLRLLREGRDLGTGGGVSWSRDELHER